VPDRIVAAEKQPGHWRNDWNSGQNRRRRQHNRAPGPVKPVTELLRTNDLVLLSFLQALLADAGITSLIADQHTSVIEGSIGAIPRRLLVNGNDLHRARRLVAEAGYALDDL
jgi:Putative prokaryotic signal transducing protein